MGNFYLILPKPGCGPAARLLFNYGIDTLCRLKRVVPRSEVSSEEWFHVASFARRNGSGGVLAKHAETHTFLVAIGTWFDDSGLGSGEEQRLLDGYLRTDASRIAAALQGFFTVVIADGRSREALVITDIVGSCHCYVRELPAAFAVSSSPVVLAALGPRSLDHVACQEFLQTGIMYEDRTFFREVRKLAPASVHRFTTKGVTSEQYWNAKTLALSCTEDHVAVRELWENLLACGYRVGRIFRRPVCDLTGGYDSRALVAAFSTQMSLSTTVSGPPDSPDVIVATKLANKVRLPLQHVAANAACSFDELGEAFALTDGEFDLVDYTRTLKTHRHLSSLFDISLNGSFGEVARGYWWELLLPRTGHRIKLDSQKLARKRYAHQGTGSLYARELRIDLASHFAEVIERTNAGLSECRNTFQMDHAYLYMRMQCWQGSIARSTNQLWPCLSPFMLRPVLAVMLAARPALRKRSFMIRKMLAQFRPTFADEPLEYGYPAAPVRLTNLHRFWPLVGYYGSKLTDRLSSNLLGHRGARPAEALKHALTNDPEVRDLLNPGNMRLAHVLDNTALRVFLNTSERKGPNHKWRCLLTLEYTLQQLARLSSKDS